jgi:hypothetical protein
MTTSPEEQALFADASQVKLERQQLNPADTAFAIQRGLAKARTRRMTGHVQLKWITAMLVTALAAAWLLMGPLGASTPQQAMYSQPAQNWGVLEPFRELAGKEADGNTISSAINNGYVQLVNRSVKSGIYQLTVNAVMADENKMIVLYTAQTDASQDIYSVNRSRVTDMLTNHKFDDSNAGGVQVPKGNHIIYGRTAINLKRTDAFPEKLMLDFQIVSLDPGKLADPKTGTKRPEMRYSELMKISFDLDPKFSVPKTEIIKLNQLFTIDGHEVMLSQVEMSPLVIQAKLVYEPNKKFDFQTKQSISESVHPYEIVSITKNGKQTKLLMYRGSETEDGMILYYSSNMLDDPQSLVLKIPTEPGKVYDDLQEAEKHKLELKIK